MILISCLVVLISIIFLPEILIIIIEFNINKMLKRSSSLSELNKIDIIIEELNTLKNS